MADDIKRMSVAEFRQLGYLQEVNRRVLHPCGLALEVVVQEDGTEKFGLVWDFRDDPEGMYFAGGIDAGKAATVDEETARHADARVRLLGAVVQPVE